MTQHQIERYEALKKLSIYLPEWEKLIDNTVRYQITSKANTSADDIAKRLHFEMLQLIDGAKKEVAEAIEQL